MSLLESVQAELGEAHCPYPDDFLEDYSPQAVVFYLWQVSQAALKLVTAAMSSLTDAEGDEQPVVTDVLNGLSRALGGSMFALVTLGVLPQEALDSLAEAYPEAVE